MVTVKANVVGGEADACPVCHCAPAAGARNVNGFVTLQCPKCSLLYVREREIDVAIYEKVYVDLPGYRAMRRAAEETAAGRMGFRDMWRYKRMALSWLEAEAPGRQLLDVGCGPGQYMLVAGARGWHATGVEPAQAATEVAKNLGLQVFCGLLSDFAKQSRDMFDAITSFEVLEHVPKPVDLLADMGALLNPRGLLAVTVPNADDPFCLRQCDAASLPPVHINFFNRRSMRALLQKTGFDVVRMSSLPVPTNSARNVLGKRRYLASLPLLLALRVAGRSDGTTLLALARKR